jgi:hypothetical protein
MDLVLKLSDEIEHGVAILKQTLMD